MIIAHSQALLLLVTIISRSSLASDYQVDEPSSDEPLSAHLFKLIDFYKQPDPQGLPVLSIPDPMPVPPIKQSIALATMDMQDVLVYGLSKLRIRLFQAELSTMSLRTEIHIDELVVNGSYTLSALFQKSSGPFQVLLTNVKAAGNVTLGVDRDGMLGTEDIGLDLGFEDMAMNFDNLGFFGRTFQNMINAAPNLVLDMIKPLMLKEVYAKMQTEIDTRIAEIIEEKEIVFVNSISPFDMALAEARRTLRRKGFDPYLVPEYKSTGGIVGIHLTHTWLRGLMSFYRSGDVEITMRNNTVNVKLQVRTGKIEGSTQWEATFIKGFSRAGSVLFEIQYLQVTVEVSQALDLRTKLNLTNLELEIGNMQIYSAGAGTLDYMVEAGVNILPNLLRYQIMDAIEGPLKARIKEKFECINMEQFVKRHVLDYERRGADMDIDWRLCERKIPVS